MCQQVGKIITFPNKFPGPPMMSANTVGEGLRKVITICRACEKFTPGRPGNCPIAEKLFQFNKEHSTGTALVRCAHFVSGTEPFDEKE